MALSYDAKVIVASNLVIAQELRRLVLVTQKQPISLDYSERTVDIFKKIMACLSDLLK